MIHDVAIVGAGVVGCAIARELTRLTARVILLEKAADACEGASKANSAVVHAGYDARPGSLRAAVNREGAALLPELAARLDVPYRRTGSLVLAFNGQEEEKLQKLLWQGRQNGVPELQLISGREARELEPALASEVQAALLAPTAGIVCPFQLTYAFLEVALANGASLCTHFEVVGLERGPSPGGSFRLTAADGRQVEARFVVNAAGINADRIAALLNEDDFRIRPRKGEYLLLDCSTGNTLERVVFQVPGPQGKGVLVTPTVYGNLLVGPNALEQISHSDTTVDQARLERVAEEARRALPALRLERRLRIFAGLRATPDGDDFLITSSRQNPGYFQAAGIDSPGLTGSPAIALRLVEMIRQAGAFSLRGDYLDERPRPEEPQAALDELVCLCEGVTARAVWQSIHRLGGATTVDGVKRRSRAGMGACQGRRCRAKVEGLLADRQRSGATSTQWPSGSSTK